ncbi:MAG: hypothetical protein RID15_13910 [Marinovum algicola]|uniref:hypothetical protein n=1 Tax=Marinovum algicola TaxID=42444 RepID=UPI0032ED655C
MNTALLMSLAAEIGAPMVERILGAQIGQGNAALARQVITRIARGAGVEPGPDLDRLIVDEPETIRDAIIDVESQAPELLALYAQGLEFQMAQLAAEQSDPIWYRAWKPGGMYLVGFLILWNAVLLHSLNAVFKIALPPVDWAIILQLATLYLGLYMGGHTVKDVAAKWVAKGGTS